MKTKFLQLILIIFLIGSVLSCTVPSDNKSKEKKDIKNLEEYDLTSAEGLKAACRDISYVESIKISNQISSRAVVDNPALGDVNSDGYIDIVDALLTAQYYVGLNPDGFNTDTADVDENGIIDILDALYIAQYYVGLINEFPVVRKEERIIFIRQTGKTEMGDTISNIFTMDINGENVEQITFGDNSINNQYFSPDNEEILFNTYLDNPNKIFLYNVKDKKMTQLSNSMFSEYEVSFSNDGEKIIFLRNDITDESNNIFIMNRDGSNVQQITSDSFYYGNPSLSSDNKKILCSCYKNQSDDSELYIMNIDGSNMIQLTDNNYSDFSPSFSRNSDEIVFIRGTGEKYDDYTNIFLMKSDGTNIKQITFGDNLYNTPYFNYDATKIIFKDASLPDNEIFIINKDGTYIQQITNNDVNDWGAKFYLKSIKD